MLQIIRHIYIYTSNIIPDINNRQVQKTLNLKTNLILKQTKLIWQISNKITPRCITEIFNAKKQTNIPIRLTTFSQNHSELPTKKDLFQTLAYKYGMKYQIN